MRNKRWIVSIMLSVIILLTACGAYEDDENTIRAGILVWKYSDTYGSAVRKAMKKYAKEIGDANGVTIRLEMQDGNEDQATQNNQADVMFASGKDIVVINLCDASAGRYIADLAIQSEVPVLFYNLEPTDPSVIRRTNSIFVGTKPEEAGIKQAELLDELYRKDPSSIDKNGDGQIDYIMFMGAANNLEAIARTKYSVETAEQLGYNMHPLVQTQVCDFDTAKAQEAMQAQIAAIGADKMECILCNNDDMAIGVIAALNNAGYNLANETDPRKKIVVLGVDATDTALESIRLGKLTGTIKQDADGMGKVITELLYNKACGRDFLDGTDYELDEDGFSIRIPYSKITQDNVSDME